MIGTRSELCNTLHICAFGVYLLVNNQPSEKPRAIITESCHCSGSGGLEGGEGTMSTRWWW